MTFTLLHQEVTNILDYKPISGPGYIFNVFGNIGNGRQDEARINWTIPFERLGITGGLLTGSYTMRDSAVHDPLTGMTRRVSFEAGNAYNLTYTQDMPDWNLFWSAFYNNGYKQDFHYLSETGRNLGKASLGTSLTYSPEPGVRLIFQVSNLFGYHNEQSRTLYAGPRDANPVTSYRTEYNKAKPSFFFSVRKAFN